MAEEKPVKHPQSEFGLLANIEFQLSRIADVMEFWERTMMTPQMAIMKHELKRAEEAASNLFPNPED